MFGLAWTFETTRPGLLLLGLSLLPVIWYFRRSLVDFARWQRRLSLAVRMLLLTALILAAAGLNLVRRDSRQFVVFLLDRSASIDPQAEARARDFVAQAEKAKGWRDEARLIEFAGRPLAPQPTSAASQPAPEQIDRDHTDLAAALTAGWASAPAFYAKTLVLLSDGRATRGDALRVAQAARAAGVRVCTVPLPAGQRDEVQLSRVQGPAQVRMGAPFELEVEVASNHPDKAMVEIFRNDIRIGRQEVELREGSNRFVLRQIASADKLQAYTLRLAGGRDHFVDNNTATVLVACEGKPRVLLIDSVPRDARYLAWALEKEDIVVDVRVPLGVPRTLADLENYDLLCLSNVPATDLSATQMQLIRSYVQDLGGGFLMLGGDKSFGLGGYYKTVLEEILPVRSDFEKEKEKPSLAMVLVIDKSGSMGGDKIELAKEAARSVVELLGPRDQIGVIAFDGESHWICQVHPAGDRGYVDERIASLVAGGGTDMAPALAEAFRALEGVSAKLKHVIALTDGISQPGNFYEVTRSMADARITVSTVAVGQGSDRDLLQRIADWGGGRAYYTEDASHIPQIFARETIEASKSAINEQPFLAQQVRPHAICQGLNLLEAPFLLGYVITRAKPTAELVLTTETGDPLLATWRYGLGKSLAFTADAKNRWGAEWLQWEGFSSFWAQVVRDTMRVTSPALMDVRLERVDGAMQVTVDALHPSPQRAGEYLDDVETLLELVRPGADVQTVPLRQVWPGRYTGRFDVNDLEQYHMRIAQRQGDLEVQSVRRGVTAGYSDEYRVGPTDETALRRIAEAGGGVFDPAPAAVFEPHGQALRVQPLWRPLLMAALLLLVLDVALRRVDLNLLAGGARSWASLAPRATGPSNDTSVDKREQPWSANV